MEVYTIGFTKKTAREFFGLLRASGIKRLVDVRLNNVSQLAGFTKRADLAFFTQEVCGAEYLHMPQWAPTQAILDAYKKNKASWQTYENQFLELLRERHVEEEVDRSVFNQPTALLCSEPTPEHCHRRLVLEYLQEKWGGLDILHL